MSREHLELRCQIPGCPFDMRIDDETTEAVREYLLDLAREVDKRRIRHVSLSVHRGVEGDE